MERKYLLGTSDIKSRSGKRSGLFGTGNRERKLENMNQNAKVSFKIIIVPLHNFI